MVTGRGNELRDEKEKLIAYKSKQWTAIIGTSLEKTVREAIFSCGNNSPAEDLAREVNRRLSDG